MLRQFLALLALVGGLAAVAEPAQAARIAAGVESVSHAEQAGPCVAERSHLVVAGMHWRGQRSRENFCPRPARTVIVPTIELQADRARE